MKMLLLLAFFPLLLTAQTRKQKKALEAQQKADQLVLANMNADARYFATTTDDAAKDYISKQFQLAGLQPKGADGYLQPFIVDDGKQIGAATSLKVNGEVLTLNKDFTPLAYSANKTVAGMPAMALREKGVPWFADVKDLMEQSIAGQPFDLEKEIQKEAAKAAAKGATALFIYNSSNVADNLNFNGKDKAQQQPIPVVYIQPDGYKKYFSDHADILDIELETAINEKNIRGNNVAGYIDNGAATTVVIGANYGGNAVAHIDMPSTNETTNSLAKNAAGIAMLIQLAKMLPLSKAKGNNYLLVAFNQEEQSMAGSRFWLDHFAAPAATNYVLNLNPVANHYTDGSLWVSGVKTSGAWKDIVSTIAGKDAGIGIDSAASAVDVSPFYQREIPVLSFSSEYKEVADTQANLKIVKAVVNVIEAANTKNKLAFSKPEAMPDENKLADNTADTAKNAEANLPGKIIETTKYVQRPTVSLGVIADNNNNGTGLRINGVSPKKLAYKIGLQPGDILTYLGTYKIGDMKTYIQALSKFKPGDKTVLGVKRGKEDKEFAVEF